MAYDLEEQEQLASLRAWWKDHGTMVAALVAVAALTWAGWMGWRLWQERQANEAGALYENVVKAIQAGDAKALRDAGGNLAEQYPRTAYASMGALAAARYHFDQKDLKAARAQLQWALERAPTDELRDLARMRLAAVMLDDKSLDEALALLEQPHGAGYAAQYAALKGDLLVAKNRAEDARAAYRLALEKSGTRNDAFRDSVQLRLDALGG